jgi:hypothetical protein
VEYSRFTDVGAEWLWSLPNTPISSKLRPLLILRSSGAGAEHLWSMSHMPISFKLRPLILKELPGPGAECCGVHPLSPISCLFMTQRVGLDVCMVGSDVANLYRYCVFQPGS